MIHKARPASQQVGVPRRQTHRRSVLANLPSPLWEPSPNHPILVYTRGLVVLYVRISFLPARRYASAGYRDRNVSVRPSVRHAPVLCQNEESQRHDFFTIW